MSVVVAVKDGDKGWIIGCDSQVSAGNLKCYLNNENACKVVETQNCKLGLIGAVGDLRRIQLIQQIDDLIPYETQINGELEMSYMVKSLFLKMRNHLIEHKAMNESDLKILDVEMIVAYKNNAYIVYGNGCVFPISEYGAIGSGYEVALGSLENDIKNGKLSTEKIVENAVVAASKHTMFVSGNIVIKKTY